MIKYVVLVGRENRYRIRARNILDAWAKAVKLIKAQNIYPNQIEIWDAKGV